MLNFKVIGCGAAGNKAAICLHNAGFDVKNITLMNSTPKDIPDNYRNNSIIFGSHNAGALGGCGKEREVGKRLIIDDMKSGQISIDSIVDATTNAVIIVSSTEGGSGSAVTPIIARYIHDVLGVPVITVLFFGFNTDVRGMQNSIEICQELQNTYGVIGISNAKYLDEANGNKIKAEQLANEEFCQIVRILCGQDIKEGSQNIDDTDLYKLVVTPGYMCVGTASLKGIKNIEMFNKAVNAAIDESHLVETTTKSAKRIGAIFSIPSNMTDFVDYNAEVLSQRYGTPYEMFTHIQDSPDGAFVSWISSGMALPIDEVKEIFENYKKATEKVHKSTDDFFSTIQNFAGCQQDGMFNMLSDATRNEATPTSSAKNSFFNFYDDGKK